MGRFLGRTPDLPERKREEFGILLFLVSLAVFFVAVLVGFLLIFARSAESGIEFEVPQVLWVSTGLLVASSMSLHAALVSVRREKTLRFRRMLVVALVLGAAFTIVQIIGMTDLYQAHDLAIEAEEKQRTVPYAIGTMMGNLAVEADPRAARPVGQFASSIWLILIHAVHFVGGLIILIMICRRAFAGKYDHEYYFGVKMCTLYWHFLDVVWIATFGALLLL